MSVTSVKMIVCPRTIAEAQTKNRVVAMKEEKKQKLIPRGDVVSFLFSSEDR